MTSALCKIFWCVWLDVIVNSVCYWVYRNTSITPSATFDFCQLIFDKLSYERLLEYAINLSFYCWSVISFTLWWAHTTPSPSMADKIDALVIIVQTLLEMMRETWELHDESLFTQRTFTFHTSQRIILACLSLSDRWNKTIYQSDMCATWFCSFAKIIKRMMFSSTQNDVCVRSHVVFLCREKWIFVRIFVCWRRENFWHKDISTSMEENQMMQHLSGDCSSGNKTIFLILCISVTPQLFHWARSVDTEKLQRFNHNIFGHFHWTFPEQIVIIHIFAHKVFF